MRIECKFDEMMKLDEVEKRWHPDNENSHSEDQIRSLAKVIAKIGIRHAIHISSLTGKIAGGHGRFLAFKKLGYDEVPIIWEHFKDEIEEINYRASDNIGQYAEFNNQEYVLNLEKVGVDIHEIDLEEFGVIDFELPKVETLDPANEDEVPEAPEEPITKRGDVWLLGDHRIMCGDSTMIDDVEKLMNGEKADMVFTDPPYGINVSNSKGTIKNDDSLEVYKDALICVNNFLTNDCHVYSFCSISRIVECLNIFSDIFEFRNILPMKRTHNGNNRMPKGEFRYNFEIAMFANLGKRDFIYRDDIKVSDSRLKDKRYKGDGILKVYPAFYDDIRATESNHNMIHPTQKNVSMSEFYISISCLSICLEPFGGSGSTLIATEKVGKKCYSMELDEKYCDVIIKRFQDYSGKEAILESTGETYNKLKELNDAN